MPTPEQEEKLENEAIRKAIAVENGIRDAIAAEEAAERTREAKALQERLGNFKIPSFRDDPTLVLLTRMLGMILKLSNVSQDDISKVECLIETSYKTGFAEGGGFALDRIHKMIHDRDESKASSTEPQPKDHSEGDQILN